MCVAVPIKAARRPAATLKRHAALKGRTPQEIAMPDQPAADSTNEASNSNTTATEGSAGIGPVLREQAGKLADRSKEAGLDTAEAVGRAAQRAADELKEETPELAHYVRDAANYTEKLAHDLRERSAAELLTEAIEWGRKRPLVALAGAAILGFALSRVVKSGLPESGHDSSERGAG
jgi:hypothetical protein